MAWTTPRTWSPGELVTAGMMNLHVRDNLTFLKPVEGTWLPIIGGTGGQSGQTYAVQTGFYTKMDKEVRAHFHVKLTNAGTITGDVVVTLPLVAATGYSTGAVLWGDLNTGWVNIVALASPGGSALFIRGCNASSVTNNVPLVSGDIGNNSFFIGTIVYRTT